MVMSLSYRLTLINTVDGVSPKDAQRAATFLNTTPPHPFGEGRAVDVLYTPDAPTDARWVCAFRTRLAGDFCPRLPEYARHHPLIPFFNPNPPLLLKSHSSQTTPYHECPTARL
jgi:hypothetical protein